MNKLALVWFILCLVALGLIVLLSPAPAHAQDPTPEPTATMIPTPTPTPAYMQDVPLTSGNVLHVERSISYGDAAIVIMALVIWVTYMLKSAVTIGRETLKK